MVMKPYFLGFAVLALAACEPDPEKVVSMETSAGGYEFAHLPVFEKDVTDITVNIVWQSDYAFQEGVNPFVPYVGTEAILSEGTSTLTPQEVMESFNDKNARGRVYAQADHVVGELIFPYEHTEFVVDVASDVLTTPTYSQNWLDRVSGQLADNQAAALNTEDHKMWDAARMAILGDTPLYNSLTLSDAAAANDVTREEVLAWHKAVFTKAPEAISVVGRITAEDAGAVIDQLLGGLPEGQLQEVTRPVGNYAAAQIFVEDPSAQKTMFGMIGVLPSTRDGADHIDLMALQALGRAEGPMFNAVRDELRASYGVRVGLYNYDRANHLLFISAEVDNEKLAQAITVAQDTYVGFIGGEGLSGYEPVQDSLVARVRERTDYVDVAAQSMAQLMLDGHEPAGVQSLADKFAAITKDSMLTRMSDAFPSPDNMVVVAIGPDASAWPEACVVKTPADVAQCPRGLNH